MRHNTQRRLTLTAWLLFAFTPYLLALTLGLTTLAGCNYVTREEKCTDNGGTVTRDLDSIKVKNGKTTTTWEYECTRNGVEIDEWKQTS